MKVTIEIRNTERIKHHIRCLNEIKNNPALNQAEQQIMFDTITILEGIKKVIRYIYE
jgi:hypothetical protein